MSEYQREALSRFAPPVTDSMEEQQRLTAIPAKTKSVTAWGIRVWNDWAAARAASISETDRLIVTTPLLEMLVEDSVLDGEVCSRSPEDRR